jgi:hypothetical protein
MKENMLKLDTFIGEKPPAHNCGGVVRNQSLCFPYHLLCFVLFFLCVLCASVVNLSYPSFQALPSKATSGPSFGGLASRPTCTPAATSASLHTGPIEATNTEFRLRRS